MPCSIPSTYFSMQEFLVLVMTSWGKTIKLQTQIVNFFFFCKVLRVLFTSLEKSLSSSSLVDTTFCGGFAKSAVNKPITIFIRFRQLPLFPYHLCPIVLAMSLQSTGADFSADTRAAHVGLTWCNHRDSISVNLSLTLSWSLLTTYSEVLSNWSWIPMLYHLSCTSHKEL